jgi:hypothetical protein
MTGRWAWTLERSRKGTGMEKRVAQSSDAQRDELLAAITPILEAYGAMKRETRRGHSEDDSARNEMFLLGVTDGAIAGQQHFDVHPEQVIPFAQAISAGRGLDLPTPPADIRLVPKEKFSSTEEWAAGCEKYQTGFLFGFHRMAVDRFNRAVGAR